MFYYARSDTHFLLYIFDELRNLLLNERDPVTNEPCMDFVLRKSKQWALQMYEGMEYGEDGRGNVGWFKPLYKAGTHRMDDQNFSVYRAVHRWRDDVARREDEGLSYILPIHMVDDIARVIPTDLKALHSLLGNRSPGAKPRVEELLGVIQAAATPPFDQSYRAIFFGELSESNIKSANISQGQDAPATGKVTRGIRSQLFGDVPLSTIWEEKSTQLNKQMKEIQISMPWAQFVEGASVEEASGIAVSDDVEMADVSAVATAKQPEPLEEEEVFTLKAGLKRKASEDLRQPVTTGADTSSSDPDLETSSSDPESDNEGNELSTHINGMNTKTSSTEECINPRKSSTDEKCNASRLRSQGSKTAKTKEKRAPKEVTGATTEQTKRKTKSTRKAINKAAKQAQKRNSDGNSTDDEIFDYANAKSVINSVSDKTSGKTIDGIKNKGEKPLFKKNLQGDIKPARRINYERPGRTQTFKR